MNLKFVLLCILSIAIGTTRSLYQNESDQEDESGNNNNGYYNNNNNNDDDDAKNANNNNVSQQKRSKLPTHKSRTMSQILSEDPLEGTSKSHTHTNKFYFEYIPTAPTPPTSPVAPPPPTFRPMSRMILDIQEERRRKRPMTVTDKILSTLQMQNSSTYNNLSQVFQTLQTLQTPINSKPSTSGVGPYKEADFQAQARANFFNHNFQRSPPASNGGRYHHDQNLNGVANGSRGHNHTRVNGAQERNMNYVEAGRSGPYFDPRPGQQFEGSNPRQQLEPTRPPDDAGKGEGYPTDAEGLGCQTIDKTMANLKIYDVNVELPIWHGYVFDTGSYNREELQITEVVAEKKFSLDRQIMEWKSLNHHAVGRGNDGLSLVTSHENGIFIDNQDFDPPVTALDMFQWWDENDGKRKTGVLTVQTTYINWHNINDNNVLIQLWSWTLTYQILHVSIYNLDGNWKVAVTHEDANYKRAISIYGLDLWKNWWFEERINGYGDPTIINNGRLMAVTMEDSETILIYKHDYDSKRYINFKNISSPNVESLAAFVVGTHSFLAVGGDRPAIYEIRGSEFEEKIVHHYNLEHIEQWLPVPLGYYRNDAIVLFQHKLDHYTHSSSVLEALQWDGKKYVLLEHSPCKSHDEEMHGFSCILDAEGEKGIKGASTFHTLNGEVNILTASEEYTPIMFEIKTELVETPDPVDQEIQEVLEHKKHLEDRLISQLKVLEEAEKIVSYADNQKEDVFFADNWKVKQIIAPSVRIDGRLKDTIPESGYVNLAGQDWKDVDLALDTTQIFDQIKNDHDRIKRMVDKLKKAVMKKDGLPNDLKDVEIDGNIVVHGKVNTKNANVDQLNNLNVDAILQNAVKKKKYGKLVIDGDVVLENLNAENINVELINGLNINDANPNKPVFIEGDLEVSNHVHVLKDITLGEHGTINNINFKTDIYTPFNSKNMMEEDSKAYALNFDSIIVKDTLTVQNTVNGYNFTAKGFKKMLEESRRQDQSLIKEDLVLDTLSVGKNINFDNINGRLWSDFIDRVVMKSEDVTLKSLKVNGLGKIGGSIRMNALNNLAYPEDYFLLDDDTSAMFTAPKTFVDALEVDEIDCEGAINGVRPENIVTLSTRQHLGNFTFFDLTVTENLNIQGNITGKELDAFLSNPHLSEMKEIKSNVIFRNLRVNGSLVVKNQINGTNWNNLFKGVIMKTDRTVHVDSLKSFEGFVRIENGLNVRSGYINNRRVADFFTMDTDQTIIGDTLYGDIAFEDLEVGGMFDDVNVTDLVDNVVTLSDDQTLTSDMIFEEIDGFDYSYDETGDVEARTIPLEVSDLIVMKHCNDWAVPNDAMFYDEESVELISPQFENLYVDHLIIEGNLLTSQYPVCGVDMDQFDQIRLSKTQDRTISAPYTIRNCSIESVDFGTLNGVKKYDIANFQNKLDNIEDLVKSGDMDIGTLHVSGNLNVSKINGVDLRYVAENAIWLKEDNYISGDMKFMEEVFVNNIRLKDKAHGVNFDSHMSDIVQVSEEPIVLTGAKVYANGLNIVNDINTYTINGINVENVLTVNSNQTIKGNLYISGNLYVEENVNVYGNVNNVSLERISNSYEYLGNNKYYLKGNFYAENYITIKNLIINGLINNFYNITEILHSTVNGMNDNYIGGTITFLKPVVVKNNLNIIEMYNNINLAKLLDDIVLKDVDTYINSSVVFKSPLKVKGVLYVEENMLCDNVQYCSIEEWKANAIYLDQTSNVRGVKQFNNLIVKGNLKTKYLNHVPFDSYITVNTDQTIRRGLKFGNVTVDTEIFVDGTVNSMLLNEAFKNILMVNENQVVQSPINFHSNVFVNKDANINFVNRKDVNKIVTTDDNQLLLGSYNFYGKSTFENDLNISGMMTNIDFNLWMKNAMFVNDYGNQIARGKWNILGNTEFQSEINGNVYINGMATDDFDNYLQQKNDIVRRDENYFKTQYNQLCEYFNYIRNIVKKKVYTFNYLKQIQTISSLELTATHYFTDKENKLILTNNKWECKGYLWKWNKLKEEFEKLNQVNTGCTTKWHTINMKNLSLLLSINDNECDCEITGTNIWFYDGRNIQVIKTLPPVDSVNIPSNEDGTFLTIDHENVKKYSIDYKDGRLETTETLTLPKPSDEAKFISTNYDVLDPVITDGKQLIKFPKLYESLQKPTVIPTENNYLSTANEIIEFSVGRQNNKIFAAAWNKEMENNYTEGAIVIYKDVLKGIEFQKISSNKPSFLTVIQLDNYQTLLLFIENKKKIPVYMYHGFEGFRHLYDLDIPADYMKSVTLNTDDINNPMKKGLILTSDDTISVVEIVMHGHRNPQQYVYCNS